MNYFLPLNVFCFVYISMQNRWLAEDVLKAIAFSYYILMDGYSFVPLADRECEFTMLFLLMMLLPFIIVYSFSEQDIFTFIVFLEWFGKYKSITTRIEQNLWNRRYWQTVQQDIILNKQKYERKKSQETCCICLDTDEEDFIKLPCKHELHYNCFIYYLQQNYENMPILCPLCRVPVYEHQRHEEPSATLILY